MLVKIKDKVYRADVEPVMVVLTNQEKKLISQMAPTSFKFCVAPDTVSEEDVRAFMNSDIVDKEIESAEG